MAAPRRTASVCPPCRPAFRLGPTDAWPSGLNVPAERWAEARAERFPDYLVSDRGRIWNARRGAMLDGFHSARFGSPYPRVKLSDGRFRSGPRKGKAIHAHFYVHRLVALAFVPGRTAARWQVHHVDGDTWNPAWWNLEWTTQRENLHARDGGNFGHVRPLDAAKLAEAYAAVAADSVSMYGHAEADPF